MCGGGGGGGANLGQNDLFYSIVTKHLLKLVCYVKDPFESKYQLLINGREKVGIKKLKNSKAFTDYSQTVNDVNENLEDCNPTKKRKIIVFDDMIADV